MVKQRIPETDHGIQGINIVAAYDAMQRNLRDRGWMETKSMIDQGLVHGHALEVGHGPGYLGLEWLKNTQGTRLTGLDISPDMQEMANKNAQIYGLLDRTQYKIGSGEQMPFADHSFDIAFSNGSLHEWSNPVKTFDEIWRVLRPGGQYFISDLRRDMSVLIRWFLWLSTQPPMIRGGLLTSIDAAYTPIELKELALRTNLHEGEIIAGKVGIILHGIKTPSQ